MKKIMLAFATFSVAFFNRAQSLQTTEKGRKFIELIEMELEGYYVHDMKPTPGFEIGMREYAYEQAGKPLPETEFDGKAHYHTSIALSPGDYELIDNCQLVKILTPDDDLNGQIKDMLTVIDPNRFFLESYLIEDKVYIVLALDRPFNYTTWRAEE
jgi:hypothetical protein